MIGKGSLFSRQNDVCMWYEEMQAIFFFLYIHGSVYILFTLWAVFFYDGMRFCLFFFLQANDGLI
jgi:hypothetical protein